ncbi:MAG: hypothetical protein RL308_1288 [Bacteroidota bacterium]|jgi:type I restriction enzyme S subunit
MTELINKLPKNWKIKKLEDLLDYIQPTKYIVKSTNYDNSYKIPVLTAGKTFVLGKTNETEGIFENLPVIIFDDFTTANKLVNFKFKVKSSAMKILKPKDENVNLLFVFYFIQTIRISFDTHKRYWISVFSKLPIALPPPETQNAIVSKIEELFSELDKGIEDLKTAQQQLKTYRQSVLKWAFEGKLTNENVKDGELPKGWEIVELGNVCSLITDGKHGDCENETNSGFYFLSAKDVKFDKLNYENARQITKSGFNETHRRTNLKPGDICMVNTGASIGRIALAPNDDKTYKTTFQKSVAVIKTIPEILNNKYCSYVLKSDLKQLMKISSGTAVPNLLLGTLKKHTINIPLNLEEQHQIVQEIESRLSVADKMEESIVQSLQQAEALRQSILKKAFSGELV